MIISKKQNHQTVLAAVVFASFLFCNFSALGQNNEASNGDLAAQIEKVLLFDDMPENKNKADFDFDANKSHDIEIQDSKLVDIIVNEKQNTVNVDIRTKEKVAYNAANSKQYEVAVELFKQVLEAEPDNYYAAFSLATIYQKLGQFKQAKILYYKLLQTHPENKEAIINNVLSLMVEESPQASLYILSKLATQNPNSSYILARSALAYSKAKNYDKAIDMMHRAIRLEPNRIDYKYNLAVIYDEAKNYEKALASYNEVMRDYAQGSFNENEVPLDKVRKRINTIKDKV